MKDLLRLLGYARPHAGRIVIAVLAAAGVGLFEAGRTALIQPIFDGLGLGSDTLPTTIGNITVPRLQTWLPAGSAYWMVVLGLLIGFSLLRGLAEFTANFLLTSVGQSVIVTLRMALFTHALDQSAAFFDRHRTAELTNALITDVEKVQSGVAQYLADALREGFTLVCLLALALMLSWKLTLLTLSVVPLLALLTATFGRRLRQSSRATQQAIEDVLALATEVLSGYRIVQAYSAQTAEQVRFQAAVQRLRRFNLRTARALFLPSPLLDVLGVVVGAGVIFYTHHLIASGELTPGAFTATLLALVRLYDPLRKLTQTYQAYQQVIVSAGRLFALLDESSPVTEAPTALTTATFQQTLALTDVAFTYPGTARPALDGVTFTIRRGETVALVGPSGGGKSTVFALLLRFYDPTRGHITLDGVDIRHVTRAALRQLVAYVPQETVLFDGTFAENIAYGRPGTTRAEIEQAARAAYAHEFILERGGYDARIGEAGRALSGGQRQRIAIARALLRNAPILLLDEATSALDAESEHLVQAALTTLMQGRTTLVIAHRLATVQRADRILVFERGRIVEAGDHATLTAAQGTYRRLYELQFTSQSS
ncbi:ABC transporter ATP-binding protein [Chloracidobacterium thermophilum]|uniref:ABC-type multidrug transport system, ATPase and permease components n=1 Tax=Chloracidobacterium thermophilum (strain B) TaxID=981222 RepID=G2LHA9_CHLTF|nr:ABC transporter transmembrane domain-containing protein [Chloracidobacterium thermophilum]AEP12172.1 ABC-type multidrug transport system, ATPase and permease components [Chloracidobacterium thermophilum B]